jgi:plastocyanin
MNLRSRSLVAGLLVFTALGCGGKTELAPAETPQPSVSSSSAQVTGKLPPHLAGTTAVAVLEPTGGAAAPVSMTPALMDQAGQLFLPPFLLAQAGQSVQFRNSEDVLHNVRVTEIATEKSVFNIATTPFGSYEHKFERPGFYSVTCDIHPTMRADILITTSPYAAKAGEDGTFTINDVPPGSYTLTLHAQGAPIVRSVDIRVGRVDLGVIQQE